jgi:hypothetical protein
MTSARAVPTAAALGTLVMAMAACAAGGSGASSPPPAAAEAPPPAAGTAQGRWLVGFVEPPVATRFAGVAEGPDRVQRMQAYAAELRAAKAPRLQALRELGARVVQTLEHSANVAIIELPTADAPRLAESIRRLPGIASVQPAGTYRTDGKPP